MKLIWRFAYLPLALCLVDPGIAAEFACVPDQCITRLNTVLGKQSPALIVAKQNCAQEGTSRRCSYRSRSGPGINMISNDGSENVQAIVIVDVSGLSAAGGVYIDAIMEAFDSSLNAEARKNFFNKMLGDFARGSSRKGELKMASKDLTYILSWDEKLTIFGASRAK